MNPLAARPTLSLYLFLALLGVATYVGGTHGVSAVRLFYLIGCIAVAVQALRLGVAYHFEAMVALFAFSPYLRRIVDYGCGFDAHGYMLSGPLLAALVPTTALPAAVMARRGFASERFAPYLLVLICLSYTAFLPLLGGGYISAITGFGKSVSVLLYGWWLLAAVKDPQQVMRQGARAFAVTMPIVGAYAIAQYYNLSPADIYWMTETAMASLGLPEPEQVRVFSTMNSPASLGNFLVFGLMLTAFAGRGWQFPISFVPAASALLLSQSRTAWLALASSILYTCWFATTRLRSLAFLIVIACATIFAVVATPLGDAVSARLETVSDNPDQDSSAQARLAELTFIFSHLDNYLLGSGTGWRSGTGTEINTQTTGAYDGMIVASISGMGIFFGLAFVIGVIWAGMQALLRVKRDAPPEFVAAAGLVAGQLVTIPLVNPTSAEFGAFFWAAIALAAHSPLHPRARRLARGGMVFGGSIDRGVRT